MSPAASLKRRLSGGRDCTADGEVRVVCEEVKVGGLWVKRLLDGWLMAFGNTASRGGRA